MKKATYLILGIAFILSSCSKNEIREIAIEKSDETIELRFNIDGLVNISQENIGGRAITDEDTWVLIKVENNVSLQEQYATFDPAFVEGGYIDTVSLNLSNVADVEYTFHIVAIRRGTAGGPKLFSNNDGSYLYHNLDAFYAENTFLNDDENRFARRMEWTSVYHSIDSTDTDDFLDIPSMDAYYAQAGLLTDTISNGLATVNASLDRKSFAVEVILKNNSALDSITVQLASLETNLFYSSLAQDSLYDIRTFSFLGTSDLSELSIVNVYRGGNLIFTQDDVLFAEDKVTRIEVDLDGTAAADNRGFFNISIEDQEIARGDTVRFGG